MVILKLKPGFVKCPPPPTDFNNFLLTPLLTGTNWDKKF